MTNLNGDSLVPAVEKALLIINYIERQKESLTLTKISRDLNIPKSSTYRILFTLQHYGYLQQSVGGQFELGARFLSLASSVKAKSSLIQVASPHMELLTMKSGETSKLSVRHDTDAITVHRVQSSREMSINTEVGRRFPLHAGASGKLFLAHVPKKLKKTLLEGALGKPTPNTIVDLDLLEQELQNALKNGYAEDNEEFIEGIKALACPVFGSSGKIVATLSVPFLATEANERKKQELLQYLSDAAIAISKDLGYSSR